MKFSKARPLFGTNNNNDDDDNQKPSLHFRLRIHRAVNKTCLLTLVFAAGSGSLDVRRRKERRLPRSRPFPTISSMGGWGARRSCRREGVAPNWEKIQLLSRRAWKLFSTTYPSPRVWLGWDNYFIKAFETHIGIKSPNQTPHLSQPIRIW